MLPCRRSEGFWTYFHDDAGESSRRDVVCGLVRPREQPSRPPLQRRPSARIPPCAAARLVPRRPIRCMTPEKSGSPRARLPIWIPRRMYRPTISNSASNSAPRRSSLDRRETGLLARELRTQRWYPACDPSAKSSLYGGVDPATGDRGAKSTHHGDHLRPSDRTKGMSIVCCPMYTFKRAPDIVAPPPRRPPVAGHTKGRRYPASMVRSRRAALSRGFGLAATAVICELSLEIARSAERPYTHRREGSQSSERTMDFFERRTASDLGDSCAQFAAKSRSSATRRKPPPWRSSLVLRNPV